MQTNNVCPENARCGDRDHIFCTVLKNSDTKVNKMAISSVKKYDYNTHNVRVVIVITIKCSLVAIL